MREQMISAIRHLAGAGAAALTTWLGAQAFMAGVEVGELGQGVEALLVAVGLTVYALVEKALKPVARRWMGSAGE